jgi:hypothetical protein
MRRLQYYFDNFIWIIDVIPDFLIFNVLWKISAFVYRSISCYN